jgi:CheY-like chemotaxis protein
MPVCQAREAPSSLRQLEIPRVECRVVIIDDNRDAANTMAMLVEHLGGSTRIAYDAASGLEAVQGDEPDVVFLDIGMPETDGYEACRQMRQLRSRKGMVIIALTGWGQLQDKHRAFEAGFDAHLTKPVDAAALTGILTGNPLSRTR